MDPNGASAFDDATLASRLNNPALGTSSSAELHVDNLNVLETMRKPQNIACTGTDRITPAVVLSAH